MMFEKEIVNEIRNKITPNNIFALLEEFGAEPRFDGDNIVARTICHNGDSHKMYYYINSQMFHCYTNCGTFDVFELVKKVKNINDFYSCVLFVVQKFKIDLISNNMNNDFFLNDNEVREEEKKYFLNLKKEDLTFTNLVNWFGNLVDIRNGDKTKQPEKSKYNTSDTFTLKPGEYSLYKGDKPIQTKY